MLLRNEVKGTDKGRRSGIGISVARLSPVPTLGEGGQMEAAEGNVMKKFFPRYPRGRGNA